MNERARASVGVFLSLAGLTCWITTLFLVMRSVMEVGGVCAEGSPYVTSTPCPKGVSLLMVASIWGSLIFVSLYAWQVIKHKVPGFLAIVWSAAYLSMAWNFLEFGLNPPGGGGYAWDWLVCAFFFMLIGGIPLYWAAPRVVRNFTRSAEPYP